MRSDYKHFDTGLNAFRVLAAEGHELRVRAEKLVKSGCGTYLLGLIA